MNKKYTYDKRTYNFHLKKITLKNTKKITLKNHSKFYSYYKLQLNIFIFIEL